jgi:hypothetical protein
MNEADGHQQLHDPGDGNRDRQRVDQRTGCVQIEGADWYKRAMRARDGIPASIVAGYL